MSYRLLSVHSKRRCREADTIFSEADTIFSNPYPEQCRNVTPEAIPEFLESFRLMRTAPVKSKLTNIEAPLAQLTEINSPLPSSFRLSLINSPLPNIRQQ